MKDDVRNLKAQAEEARYLYRIGKIERQEAASLIQPYAEVFNKTSKEIAKKYGQRAKLFSLPAFLR